MAINGDYVATGNALIRRPRTSDTSGNGCTRKRRGSVRDSGQWHGPKDPPLLDRLEGLPVDVWPGDMTSQDCEHMDRGPPGGRC